jgi:hypothetical protein
MDTISKLVAKHLDQTGLVAMIHVRLHGQHSEPATPTLGPFVQGSSRGHRSSRLRVTRTPRGSTRSAPADPVAAGSRPTQGV